VLLALTVFVFSLWIKINQNEPFVVPQGTAITPKPIDKHSQRYLIVVAGIHKIECESEEKKVELEHKDPASRIWKTIMETDFIPEKLSGITHHYRVNLP